MNVLYGMAVAEVYRLRVELDAYKKYVGGEMAKSDFQTVGDMRKELEQERKRADDWEKISDNLLKALELACETIPQDYTSIPFRLSEKIDYFRQKANGG